jgi:branched-chain amino acid transport system substrate-binding protein
MKRSLQFFEEHRIGRRQLLQSVALGGAGLGASALLRGLPAVGAPTGTPIKIGTIHDLTGAFAVYNQATRDIVEIAVEEINARGGVLGRPVELLIRDSQSSIDKYAEFANELVLGEKVAMLEGGGSSASREVIRQVIDRNGGPVYFYPAQYEGGVCDKFVFCSGEVPTQQIGPALIPYAMEHFGGEFYTIAADYNFGHISSVWVKKFVEQQGGRVIATEFFPLDQTDFGSAISRIQAARPQVIFSLLVGNNHLGFHRQFAAAGLVDKIPIVSPVFGQAGELTSLSPQEYKGLVVAFDYFPQLDNPANKAFLDRVRARHGGRLPYAIGEFPYNIWLNIQLWAAATNKAASIEKDKVIDALESGLQLDAPEGRVRVDGKTHHLVHSIHIAQASEDRSFKIIKTIPDVQPSYEQSVCDIISRPRTHKQFTPE